MEGRSSTDNKNNKEFKNVEMSNIHVTFNFESHVNITGPATGQ
jgi:hypothetical protein